MTATRAGWSRTSLFLFTAFTNSERYTNTYTNRLCICGFLHSLRFLPPLYAAIRQISSEIIDAVRLLEARIELVEYGVAGGKQTGGDLPPVFP